MHNAEIGMSHSTGLFSRSGHTMKPVTCATMAAISTITFTNRFESLEFLDRRPSMAGIMHIQFVIMAPLTTSNSGRILKNSSARPIVCKDSAMKT